jgi:type III pantothenate kinase
MMSLLIDIGNSRLKWAVLEDNQLEFGQALVNSDINQQELVNLWKDIPEQSRVICASVAKGELLELVFTVVLLLWPKIEIIPVKVKSKAYGVGIAYQKPEKMGVDRWLGLIAVWKQYALPACIVDCGTAITIDLIDAKGHHQGGMICPGLRLMKTSLADGTEALPFNEKTYAIEPASFTEAAIYSGTLLAVTGLIEQVYAMQTTSLLLILTGGDAELIAKNIKTQHIIDSNLVLHGLAIVLEGKE